MACIDYFCHKCHWQDTLNTIYHNCPKCSSPIQGFFDEQPEMDDSSREAIMEKEDNDG